MAARACHHLCQAIGDSASDLSGRSLPRGGRRAVLRTVLRTSWLQLDSKIASRARASVGRLTGSHTPVHHIIPRPRLFLSLSRISYS
jgi:hypothetical protein